MTDKVAAKLIVGMPRAVRSGVVKLRDFVQGRPSARKMMAEVKSIEGLVATGKDPLHAAYIRAQNYLSVFSETSSQLREFKEFTAVVGKAEDNYVPGWPPMSPVSVSFFTCWALLDQPVGASGETMCSCAIDIGRAFGMPADFTHTLEVMGESAAGIYQHMGWRDGLVSLRDILDDRVHRCIVPSGYRGTKGELWYIRLLPPLDESFDYGVVFTSPYVLYKTKEADWFAFFERQERNLPLLATTEEKILRRKAFFKQGPQPYYWLEYVFFAFHDSSESAIELWGIPDIPGTLPHARLGR